MFFHHKNHAGNRAIRTGQRRCTDSALERLAFAAGCRQRHFDIRLAVDHISYRLMEFAC